MLDWLSHIDAWLYSPEGISQPTLFLVSLGGLIGYFVIPEIISFFVQEKNHREFDREFGGQRVKISKLFGYINKAYNEWKKQNVFFTSVPAQCDLIVKETAFPYWIIKKTKGFRAEAKNHGLSPDTGLEATLWGFCYSLYKEIEDSHKHRGPSPSLLTQEECGEFHDLRIELNDFFQRLGTDIRRGRIRYYSVRATIESQEILLKLLTFLGIALWFQHEKEYIGDIDLYRILIKHFKKKARRDKYRRKVQWLVENISALKGPVKGAK